MALRCMSMGIYMAYCTGMGVSWGGRVPTTHLISSAYFVLDFNGIWREDNIFCSNLFRRLFLCFSLEIIIALIPCLFFSFFFLSALGGLFFAVLAFRAFFLGRDGWMGKLCGVGWFGLNWTGWMDGGKGVGLRLRLRLHGWMNGNGVPRMKSNCLDYLVGGFMCDCDCYVYFTVRGESRWFSILDTIWHMDCGRILGTGEWDLVGW